MVVAVLGPNVLHDRPSEFQALAHLVHQQPVRIRPPRRRRYLWWLDRPRRCRVVVRFFFFTFAFVHVDVLTNRLHNGRRKEQQVEQPPPTVAVDVTRSSWPGFARSGCYRAVAGPAACTFLRTSACLGLSLPLPLPLQPCTPPA